MNSLKRSIILALLLVNFGAVAQKKNSIVVQTGILNYFYDSNPILMNTSKSGKIDRIRDFTDYTLIKSIGIDYNREINQKSSLTFSFNKFSGYFGGNEKSRTNKEPEIAHRDWYLLSLCFNRKLIDRAKFEWTYGGGLQYREGTEAYQVFYEPPNPHPFHVSFLAWQIDKREVGLNANSRIKYSFLKSLFLYSKLDIQYYIYDAGKPTFDKVVEESPSREFNRTFPLNHTFTIGLGWDF